MLLSFNKFSISALIAPIYLISRRNVVGENSKILPQLRSQLQCVSPIIYRFLCIQYMYHVIISSDID